MDRFSGRYSPEASTESYKATKDPLLFQRLRKANRCLLHVHRRSPFISHNNAPRGDCEEEGGSVVGSYMKEGVVLHYATLSLS